MKRFLHWNSLIILPFVIGCISVKKGEYRRIPQDSIPVLHIQSPFHGTFDKAFFRANLTIRKHELSGMVLIKRSSDSSFRFYFANAFGMTFFDLESHPDGMIIHSVFEPLKKKVLLHLIEKNLHIMFFPLSDTALSKYYRNRASGELLIRKGTVWFHCFDSLSPPEELLTQSSFMTKTVIRYSNWNDRFPASILLFNEGIGFRMDLRLIKLN